MSTPEQMLEEAAGLLREHPRRVIDLCQEVLLRSSRRGLAIAGARARVLIARAHHRLGGFPPDAATGLESAIATFRANDERAQWCEAMGVQALLLVMHRQYRLATATSMAAFYEARAPASTRLVAAQAALMLLVGPAHDNRATWDFLAQVTALCGSSPATPACLAAQTSMAVAEFAGTLARAGIANASYPYPHADIDRDQARQMVRSTLDELERAIAGLPAETQVDTETLLGLALLAGFAKGVRAATAYLARATKDDRAQVLQAVAITRGMVWFNSGNAERALADFQTAQKLTLQFDPWHMSWVTHFYLWKLHAQAGRYRDALNALARFHQFQMEQLSLGASGRQAVAVAASPETMLDVELPSGAAQARYVQSEPPYLRQALRFMKKAIAEKIAAREIVDAAQVSRRTLENAFKTYRHSTMMAELRRLRMETAMRMLLSTSVRLPDIRLSVGYDNVAGFSRDFRKYFGVRPSDVRRSGQD